MNGVEVEFSVRWHSNNGEVVCLTGDVEKLGGWKTCSVIIMDCAQGSDLWTTKVSLSVGATVHYRYAICVYDDELLQAQSSPRKMAVLKWETHLNPRQLTVDGDTRAVETAIFGVISKEHCVDKGWLLDQTEVLFKLHDNPVHLLKRSLHDRTYRIKCRHVDLSVSEPSGHVDVDEESLQYDRRTSDHPFQVYASTLRSVKDAHSRLQDERGELYSRDDYLIFRAQTFIPETTGFIFDIYVCGGSPDDKADYLGQSCFLPQRQLSLGSRTLSITASKGPVGQITLDFLYIKPMPDNCCDFSRSYSKYWSNKRGPLDIGHRGMGITKPRDRAIPENTIHSFNTAGANGADYVEFDVQLCKDKEVVVYHDFKLCLTMRKRKSAGNEFFEANVKDLTLKQLQHLRLDHRDVLHGEHEVFADDEDDVEVPADWQSFPTLEKVFEGVDPLVGFDIEIKYPMSLVGGEHELENFFDQNFYIDTILQIVLRHAGKRRIMITCFDPDICSILRMKQGLYPTVLTAMGENDIWTPYGDTRTHTYQLGVYHCLFDDCLGISAYWDELVKHQQLFTDIRKEGLVLITWGRLCDQKTMEVAKSMGVNALIYDRITELKGTANIFRLEQEKKQKKLTTAFNAAGDISRNKKI